MGGGGGDQPCAQLLPPRRSGPTSRLRESVPCQGDGGLGLNLFSHHFPEPTVPPHGLCRTGDLVGGLSGGGLGWGALAQPT